MSKLKNFLFVLPSLFYLYGLSQPVTPATELDYIIEEFTLPGGRLGNNVNAIVQGPYGFIWFGTHGGLHRYDGFEFVTYKNVPGDTIGETTSLTFPYVENLYWDKNNMLWVTTYGGGLYRFDPVTETFKHYVHDPNDSTSISNQSVTCAIEDANGELWFGTTNGLNRFDRETEKFKRYYANPQNPDSLQANDVRSLYVDRQGTLWIGAGFVFFGDGTGALSRYNPESDSFTNYTYDPNDETSIWTSAVRGMLEDSHGNFWIGTSMGLQKMNRSEGTFERMPYDPSQPYAPGANNRQKPAVYSIHEDKKGGVWIGTVGEPSYQTHLLRYDPETKKAQVFPIQFSVWSICESPDGTIWTAGAGLSGKVLKIKPKTRRYNLYQGNFIDDAFRKTDLSRELNFNIVLGPFAMAIDPVSGNYWLQLLATNRYNNFTDGAIVLANYNPLSRELSFHYLRDLKPDIDWSLPANQFGISGLLIDNKGTLWGSFPSANIGIFNYDPTTKKLKHYGHDPDDPESLTSNSIITLMMDSRGEIWAATFENGLNRLNPVTKKITQYHFNEEDLGEYDNPIALMEDSEGKIWVGGELMSDGVPFIAIIDPIAETIKKINLSDWGTFRVITTLARSPNGNVAFTIQDGGIGIYYPEGDVFIFIGKDSGFPFVNAAGVVCDREGYFWVADTESSTFVRFSREDYFVFEETDEFGAGWRSGILGPNGHVYFLSRGNGWFEIDPSTIRPEISTTASKVQLVDLYMLGDKQNPIPNTVLDKPIWLMDEIVFPNSADNFGFRFSDFDFQNPSPQFEYRLYPYETTWKKSGYSPTANYYKVPSGTYTFQVKSFNQRGLKEEPMVELKVVILPPWWQTWWAYGTYGLTFIGGVFLVDRIQRRRLLAKAKAEAREKELEQAREIEKAYKELKLTQSQLIQSEKMASLGELTAGIAHEIQNPLNFVNNFSEVNKELLIELDDEVKKGNFTEVQSIAKSVIENEEKIIFHGKRADGIVKGMLQHSRSSSGVKEPTDINALADEYLRLAYHGLRAKDKLFNATMKTDFDETIGNINIIPQDIGRVILNLITNAFYVVNEKKTLRQAQPDSSYEPTVTVSTKKEGNNILISVKDNGNGIPQHIKEKIFQPFFTTKPTGQGTGLGLSLSYDIVKAHGGEIKIESKEGMGSEFVIQLPIV